MPLDLFYADVNQYDLSVAIKGVRLSLIGSKQGSLVNALSFIKYSVREAESSWELLILIPTTLDLGLVNAADSSYLAIHSGTVGIENPGYSSISVRVAAWQRINASG